MSNDLRKLRVSLGPDSYFRYKQDRKYERKQEDRVREYAKDSADHARDAAERERGYQERYTRERDRDSAREQTERAEEIEPDR